MEESKTELQGLRSENKEQSKKLEEQDKQIAQLEEQNKLYRKLQYASKSEKWTPQDSLQAFLFDEAEAETESPQKNQSTEEKVSVRGHSRKKAGRKGLDPSLPRKEIVHDLAQEDKQCKCGNNLEKIGEDSREELGFQPARLWVNKHIYPKYACPCCNDISDEAEVKSAPQKAIIPRSFASPSLLSHILVSKFEDHLPYYRMERILSRLNITLPRATMCNWTMQIGKKVVPILDIMYEDMMKSRLSMIDETTLQVMREPGRKNTTKSYMWGFRGEFKDRSILLSEYHSTRSGEVVSRFLEDYEGARLGKNQIKL